MEFTPKLLNGNKEKLEDIFNLRVEAWDKSEYRSYINKELYPNGLKDELDDSGMHWYIEDQDKIIGCSRLNMLSGLSDFKLGKAFENFDIPAGPFVYFSRIAVHPDYQHKHLSVPLAAKTVEEFKKSKVSFGLTLFHFEGFAERFGFNLLGKVKIGTDENNLIANAYLIRK